jgi:hypothetical protein
MSLGVKLLKVLGIMFLYFVVFDVVGVVASLFFDVMPLRGTTPFLFYTIWFVLGVFCGLFGFNSAAGKAAGQGEGDWSTRADSGRIGMFVIAVTTAMLAGFGFAFYSIIWRTETMPDYFVPDSPSLTVTFFAAILGSQVLGNTVLRPTK